MPLADMKDDLPEAKGLGLGAETSAVMGLRGATDPEGRRWYRDLHIPTWVWLGADAVRLQALLARLAVAQGPRTRDDWLDTAVGHRPGNWIYEWSQEGAQCQVRGRELLTHGDHDGARTALLRAAHYYTIASYPHIRGDRLAHEAMTLAISCYRDAGKLFPHPLKVMEVDVGGKPLVMHLHLPPQCDEAVPAVLLCGGGDQLQTGFYRFFSSGLAAAGIALITLDLPGVGLAERWPLSEDYDHLYRAALEAVAANPQFDSRRLALLGIRLGGTAAVRAALTHSELLRACVTIGAPVHDLFVDASLIARLTPMVRDQLASRLRLDATAISGLSALLQPLSLVRQGLLGRRPLNLPLLAIGVAQDPAASVADTERISRCSRHGRQLQISGSLHDRLAQALASACSYLIEQLR